MRKRSRVYRIIPIIIIVPFVCRLFALFFFLLFLVIIDVTISAANRRENDSHLRRAHSADVSSSSSSLKAPHDFLCFRVSVRHNRIIKRIDDSSKPCVCMCIQRKKKKKSSLTLFSSLLFARPSVTPHLLCVFF